MKYKDTDRAHQQLNQKLALAVAAIRSHEKLMAQKKGKVSSAVWETMVRDLRKLNKKKNDIHAEIAKLNKQKD